MAGFQDLDRAFYIERPEIIPDKGYAEQAMLQAGQQIHASQEAAKKRKFDADENEKEAKAKRLLELKPTDKASPLAEGKKEISDVANKAINAYVNGDTQAVVEHQQKMNEISAIDNASNDLLIDTDKNVAQLKTRYPSLDENKYLAERNNIDQISGHENRYQHAQKIANGNPLFLVNPDTETNAEIKTQLKPIDYKTTVKTANTRGSTTYSPDAKALVWVDDKTKPIYDEKGQPIPNAYEKRFMKDPSEAVGKAEDILANRGLMGLTVTHLKVNPESQKQVASVLDNVERSYERTYGEKMPDNLKKNAEEEAYKNLAIQNTAERIFKEDAIQRMVQKDIQQEVNKPTGGAGKEKTIGNVRGGQKGTTYNILDKNGNQRTFKTTATIDYSKPVKSPLSTTNVYDANANQMVSLTTSVPEAQVSGTRTSIVEENADGSFKRLINTEHDIPTLLRLAMKPKTTQMVYLKGTPKAGQKFEKVEDSPYELAVKQYVKDGTVPKMTFVSTASVPSATTSDIDYDSLPKADGTWLKQAETLVKEADGDIEEAFKSGGVRNENDEKRYNNLVDKYKKTKTQTYVAPSRSFAGLSSLYKKDFNDDDIAATLTPEARAAFYRDRAAIDDWRNNIIAEGERRKANKTETKGGGANDIIQFVSNGKTYNIPKNQEQAFLKDNPQAKRK